MPASATVSQPTISTTVPMWKVGDISPQNLSLTPEAISLHLLNDWLPQLPVGQGVSFMGWPSLLLLSLGGSLSLSEHLERAERQWKGTISWMLGVAGARAYLNNDGYRWIAPVSAFFENAIQPVTVQPWNLPFPEPDLTIKRIRSGVLCPDFIAAKSSADGAYIEWAVAEAKGTAKSLARRTPLDADWRAQVRNITVTSHGLPLNPHRHVVIATRINPAGPDRGLRIKAWNSEEPDDSNAFANVLPEVVSAHLFGLYSGLGLSSISSGLAMGVYRRATEKYHANQAWIGRMGHRAETRLAEIDRLSERIGISVGEGKALAELSGPLRGLTEALINIDNQEEAIGAVREADRALDDWWRVNGHRQSASIVTLPFGITAEFF